MTKLAAAVAMAIASAPASATFYTDLSMFQITNAPTYQTNVTDVNGVTGVGATYTNNITTNTPNLGGTIRVVGSNLLSTYSLNTGFTSTATYNGLPLVGVFAVEGVTSAPMGGVSTANFTSGRLGFFTISSAATYNTYNPLSWGATNAAGTLLNTPVAVFELAAPTDVKPGTGYTAFNLGAGSVNTAGINVTAPTDTQGNFLFSPENTSLVNSDGSAITPNPGSNWLTVTNPTGDPAKEGLISQINQHVIIGTALQGFMATGSAGLDAMNTIAQVLGGLGQFASSVCNPATCTAAQLANPLTYNITSALSPTGTNSADIRATLGTITAPGTVPEPAVLALMGIGLAGLGFRMRKSKA